MEDESYSNIRDIIAKDLVGRTVVDITQHDEEYFLRTGRSFVDLMFDDGMVFRIYFEGNGPCMALNPDDETEAKMFGDR